LCADTTVKVKIKMVRVVYVFWHSNSIGNPLCSGKGLIPYFKASEGGYWTKTVGNWVGEAAFLVSRGAILGIF
jgi:hypothetical protein